jgi:hypothetical protein
MPAIYWICIFLNKRFHERSFIVVSTDRSERRDLTGIATSPLSENADSDGTDEPMHMSVSRASSDNRGKRSWPMVAHHATTSWHRSSPALVNWKKSSISLPISSLSCSACDSGLRIRSRRAETRMVLVFLFDSDDSAARVFATPWMPIVDKEWGGTERRSQQFLDQI